ncbi:hypothetical protein EYZ11_000686 [Aspergillus tanneri]|uniref:Uncharacterized protein n=1 Tax=Aspergillus tanneri TaxID=1220188 RepID=A0A4S3JWK5_9EURO|nr:hypothetical protein EYZ11_000686 [Aspergillus tanneri]
MGSAISSCLDVTPPLRDFFHLTGEAYMIILDIFQYFPLVSIIQWLSSFHPAGKTSLKKSYLNLPGRLGWFIMEIVGPINLLYILWTLRPAHNPTSLPLPNKLVVSLYLLHYLNRAIISPWLAAPSMSPIHALVFCFAVLFNWLNSTCLAGWLVGYRIPIISTSQTITEVPLPSTSSSSSLLLPSIGLVLFILGMTGNIHSERTLFRLRREEAETRLSKCSDTHTPFSARDKFSKVYVIPPATGLFRSILYPHYVCEWFEWLGFALVGTAIFPGFAVARRRVFSQCRGEYVTARPLGAKVYALAIIGRIYSCMRATRVDVARDERLRG